MLQRGDILDNTYQIIEEIGTGGTGIVYKALHLRLQKYVVVKKIRDSIVGKINIRAEADILKKLRHTYLPQVYDFLQIGDQVYTIIDYIDGKSLAYYIKHGYDFHQKQILVWARQLCEALVYLHGQTPSIIHSDIKPGNIMITAQGNVCLIDFNISLDGQYGSQISGISEGYAPPEQHWNVLPADGNSAVTGTASPITAYRFQMKTPLDTRSDIYSLGATLYHMMTKIRPPRSTEPVPPLSGFDLPFNEVLIQIVSKAMRPDPNDRYQSAQAMLHDLNHIYKMDSRYKKLQLLQHGTTVLFAALLIFFAVLAYAGVCRMNTEKSQTYDSYVDAGKLDMKKQDYPSADRQFDEAMRLNSTRLEAYSGKLLLLSEQQKYAEAETYGESVLTNTDLQENLDKSPEETGDICYMTANAYFESENYEKACVYYAQAVEKRKENPEYYRDYAIALARMKKTEQAEEILKQAKELNLADDSVLLVQAELALAKENYSAAVSDFQKAIRNTKDDTLRQRAYILCSQALRADGNIDGEISVLEEARTKLPAEKTGVILPMLGDAYAGKARQNTADIKKWSQKALDCYLLAEKSGSTSEETQLNTALLYQQLDNYDQAKKTLLDLQSEYATDYRVYLRLALLESNRQSVQGVDSRDYKETEKYYLMAKKYYQQHKVNGESDPEMQTLEKVMDKIYSGHWLERKTGE